MKGTYLSNILHIEHTEDRFVTEMPIYPLTHNPLNIVHGGAIATMIDTAIGALVHQELPKDKAAVTSDLQVRYLKAAAGSQLTCRCSWLHKGRSTMSAEAKVFREDGALCAHSTASFFIIDK